ncbi:MAG: hypothetical protein GY765_01355 [bacterium]|nr:hypothetical protein [bacterium]
MKIQRLNKITRIRQDYAGWKLRPFGAKLKRPPGGKKEIRIPRPIGTHKQRAAFNQQRATSFPDGIFAAATCSLPPGRSDHTCNGRREFSKSTLQLVREFLKLTFEIIVLK